MKIWFSEVAHILSEVYSIEYNGKGEAVIVRYADDSVYMFQYENEAKEFFVDLKERMAKFGLEIAEDNQYVILVQERSRTICV